MSVKKHAFDLDHFCLDHFCFDTTRVGCTLADSWDLLPGGAVGRSCPWHAHDTATGDNLEFRSWLGVMDLARSGQERAEGREGLAPLQGTRGGTRSERQRTWKRG